MPYRLSVIPVVLSTDAGNEDDDQWASDPLLTEKNDFSALWIIRRAITLAYMSPCRTEIFDQQSTQEKAGWIAIQALTAPETFSFVPR